MTDSTPATAARRWAEDNDHRCEAVQPMTLQRCEYVPGHDLPHMAFTTHSTTAWGIERGVIHE